MKKRSAILCVAGVIIVGVVALSSFMQGPEARARVCLNNLYQIDGAKDQAVGESTGPPPVVTLEEIEPFIRDGFASLRCPDGGAYSIGRDLEIEPTCSVHDSLRLQ